MLQSRQRRRSELLKPTPTKQNSWLDIKESIGHWGTLWSKRFKRSTRQRVPAQSCNIAALHNLLCASPAANSFANPSVNHIRVIYNTYGNRSALNRDVVKTHFRQEFHGYHLHIWYNANGFSEINLGEIVYIREPTLFLLGFLVFCGATMLHTWNFWKWNLSISFAVSVAHIPIWFYLV